MLRKWERGRGGALVSVFHMVVTKEWGLVSGFHVVVAIHFPLSNVLLRSIFPLYLSFTCAEGEYVHCLHTRTTRRARACLPAIRMRYRNPKRAFWSRFNNFLSDFQCNLWLWINNFWRPKSKIDDFVHGEHISSFNLSYRTCKSAQSILQSIRVP